MNGGERSLLSVLPTLQERGFAVSVMAPPDGPAADAFATAGVAVIPFVAHGAEGRRLSQALLRQRLSEALTAFDPDLLHANSLAMGRLAGPVARDVGLPCIAHLRDIIKLSAAAIQDLNANSRLLAVSQATREFHVAQGLSAEKTHVLYNGVDLDEFRPRPATGYLHRELRIDPDFPLIGSIGQLVMRKGTDVFVEAADLLADELPNSHFVIVGERYSQKPEALRFEQDLHEQFAAGSLAGRVHFLGRRDDVNTLLNELTLLVHPARQEPLGRVLLEAAAAGLAVVATDVGGTSEIFPPDSNSARLVPPDDARAMAGEIRRVLNNLELRESIGRAARRRAVEKFDVRIASEQLARHYSDVLTNCQRLPRSRPRT